MKNYIKPEINTQNFSANCAIASTGISDWLEGNGMKDHPEAITTYYYSES